MFWNRMIHLFLGGSVLVAHPLSPAGSESPSIDELLTYECARDVATLADVERPTGPLFSAEGLLLTSVDDAALRPRLVLSAGGGVHSLGLPHEGLNRLRFDLYDLGARRVVTYYLGYLHDPARGSRLLEFGAGSPLAGHFEFDYLAATPKRAAELRPHLEYAIFTTSASLRKALDEGRVARTRVRPRSPDSCDHLARENPALAQSLERNLEYFDRVAGATARRPARVR